MLKEVLLACPKTVASLILTCSLVLLAVVSYPAHLSGGTGKFSGATVDFTAIGEADLNTGRLVLRYSGQVCFAAN